MYAIHSFAIILLLCLECIRFSLVHGIKYININLVMWWDAFWPGLFSGDLSIDLKNQGAENLSICSPLPISYLLG